jgi:hypothetical protein
MSVSFGALVGWLDGLGYGRGCTVFGLVLVLLFGLGSAILTRAYAVRLGELEFSPLVLLVAKSSSSVHGGG